MGKEESSQAVRRTTRLSASSPNSKFPVDTPVDTPKDPNPQPLTLNDLVFCDAPLSFDDLVRSFPGRRTQIVDLLRLLGPVNSPIIPLFIYGAPSSGKTSTVLQIFRHLQRPFVYSSCRTCYNPKILFESVLDQLLMHRKDESNDYSSAKRCEKPSDFVNFLSEALGSVSNSLKECNKGKLTAKKLSRRPKGSMVYLIFDNVELVRDWDKGSTILPFLFKLYDILKMNDIGLIFISSSSPDAYYSETGYIEPIPVYFNAYTEEDFRQIFTKNQDNPKLYSSFLDVVLRPFIRVTRRVDELYTVFTYLYEKYCEPLTDKTVPPNEEKKRKLFSHLQPHISLSLNDIFRVLSRPSLKANTKKNDMIKHKATSKKQGAFEAVDDDIDFHMSVSAKYLLISAFIASRNPATLDASLFDSTGGSDGRKRKRKSSDKSMEQKEAKEQELPMKGPGTFPLERLVAIYQCITSVEEYPHDESQEDDNNEFVGAGLMSEVLLQLSSLCNANFITKGGSCPLEGSARYRSTVSEDTALQVARSLKFPLSKYLYRR